MMFNSEDPTLYTATNEHAHKGISLKNPISYLTLLPAAISTRSTLQRSKQMLPPGNPPN
jgi:hypothetical protein